MWFNASSLSCLGPTVLVVLAPPAIAGPPFVFDDPEPIPQFEINNGTNTRDDTGDRNRSTVQRLTFNDLARGLQSVAREEVVRD